jgi:hypothetical protein
MMGNRSFKDCDAFWISPRGCLQPVYNTHIGEVIKDPGLFGLKADYILSEYNKENESLGIEGRARRTSILLLIRRGWIRIRRYPRKGSWTVNVRSFGVEDRRQVTTWAKEMIDSGVSCYEIVRIDLPEKIIGYELCDLMGH